MSAIVRIRRFPWLGAVVLGLVLIGTLLPVYWMVASSFKTSAELSRIPATLWPESLSLEQFTKVFEEGSLVPATIQSITIAIFTTFFVVIFGSAAAYAVTHLRFRWTKSLLSLSLVTQLLPQAATLVPIFILWTKLGLVNTLPGIVLIYVAFQLPVAVWIISGHFSAIPREVLEAANVDGSGTVRTLVRIVMPMASPGIAAVAIWCVIGCWSELLFALVLLSGENKTVPVSLAGLIGEHSTDQGLLLAAATLAALPPLILFFFLQKYFTNGLAGAVKG
ncbi:carbohydrate ABC transporter permease [Arthrobacter sp. HY1533]|uniref:carbohydrate ABC transporter permease n=1 Tax=Arthrobacter sp. HY1533 TaxID=2970919 RepID=UPI0022B9E912|nr:carbohydrate ABC transporter permease [Arthrobacter sp. HY1533]